MKTNLKKHFNLFLWISLIVLMSVSCIPQKKMVYLQAQTKTDTITTFQNERDIEYKVQPGDNLYIRIVTLDEKTTLLLNPLSGGGSQTSGSGDAASLYLNSYSVNQDGFIDFPMTGEVFVKNMTVEEIINVIRKELTDYMKEFIVIVKLVNFNITLLGEINSPGQYKIYQSNISIFEAVSMGGDLTDFANRNKVAIIRQTKSGSEVSYIDMTNIDLLLSDYYYLKPNDIVYAQPVKGKQFTFANFPYGVVFGFISTTILLLSYIKN
ncbi:MAG: polysaccharide biosynthesis/export family protein [Bacteroidales bacterium]|nr:polysaccharide biosynthesis/export family protein [Bacteroidales bacterium]